MPADTGNDSRSGNDTTESHQRIREAARAHVLARADQLPGQIEVKIARLDPRLRLRRCERPLETYDSPNGLRPGRNVVGVRCTGQHPWKLYVTVDIATLQPVVVAARPLARGQQVSRSARPICASSSATPRACTRPSTPRPAT